MLCCSVVLGVEVIWQVLGVVCLVRHYNTCRGWPAMQAVLGKSSSLLLVLLLVASQQ